jgi:hypothetical protein
MTRERLEKENAELKKTILQFQKDSYCGVCHFKTKTQLTKAKEIIKKIVKIFYSGENAIKRLSEISDILADAEQFLKETSYD